MYYLEFIRKELFNFMGERQLVESMQFHDGFAKGRCTRKKKAAGALTKMFTLNPGLECGFSSRWRATSMFIRAVHKSISAMSSLYGSTSTSAAGHVKSATFSQRLVSFATGPRNYARFLLPARGDSCFILFHSQSLKLPI